MNKRLLSLLLVIALVLMIPTGVVAKKNKSFVKKLLINESSVTMTTNDIDCVEATVKVKGQADTAVIATSSDESIVGKVTVEQDDEEPDLSYIDFETFDKAGEATITITTVGKNKKGKALSKIVKVVVKDKATIKPTCGEPTEGPASSYDSATKEGAWSYVEVTPITGFSSRTKYVYSNYETTKPPIMGKVEEVNGLTYDAQTNTLIMNSYSEEDMILDIKSMGTGFTLKLEGTNAVRSLQVSNEKWASGLTIKGSGSLTLGNKSDHSRIPMSIDGDLTMEEGATVTCIAEVTDVQSISGLRYSFILTSENETPIRSALACGTEMTIGKTEEGKTLVRSKEDVVFTGEAMKAPAVKRRGKRVLWKSDESCTYQVLVGGQISDVETNKIKNKEKLRVRALKDCDWYIAFSPWSKEV